MTATHPAILKSQELFDVRDEDGALRDLDDNERALRTAVDVITWRKVAAYKAAQNVWGDIPRQYRACLIIADEKERLELDAALAAYMDGLEYQDKLEEVVLAIAS